MTRFEQELRDAQPALLVFVRVLCGAPQEAEDIVGDVNLALIRHQTDYDTSRPFLPWARAYAYNAVRAWRRRNAASRLVLDDGLVERLGERLASGGDGRGGETRLERLLEEAKKELTPEMQYLLTRHYVYGDKLAAIGRQLNRTPRSLAVSLHYIRGVLRKSLLAKMKEGRV